MSLYLAPAKLNLFLHITSRRADGYHLLESAFVLIDLCDELQIQTRQDGQIVRSTELAGVPPEQDLVVRAAQLLRNEAVARHTVESPATLGAQISVKKNIPMGGGLGGGSSDAATVLIVLNHLWKLNFSRELLAEIGLKLGADVPFFIFGQSAFARGVGEKLAPLPTPKAWFVVLHPPISVPTPAVFAWPELTRHSKSAKIEDFSTILTSQPDWVAQASQGKFWGENVLEPAASALFPALAVAKNKLLSAGFYPRMSGSGSCFFMVFTDALKAEKAKDFLRQQNWGAVWVARSLSAHPQASLLGSRQVG